MNRKELRQKVYEKYDGHCAYCGKKISIKDMQMDHIKPAWHNVSQEQLDKLAESENIRRIEKGNNDIENLNPSCRQCNFRKGTRGLEEFRKELELQAKRIIKYSFQVRQSLDYGLLEYHDHPVRFYFEKPLTFLEEIERQVTDLNKLKDKVDYTVSDCSQDKIIGSFVGAAHACAIDYYINLDRFKKMIENMTEPFAYIDCYQNYVLSTFQDYLAEAVIEIVKAARKNKVTFTKNKISAFAFDAKNDLLDDCYQIIDEIKNYLKINAFNISDLLNIEIELLDKLAVKHHIQLYQFVNARIIYETEKYI